MSQTPALTATNRFPPQVKYIVGNEACERFSYYGMRNILTVFLIDYLLTHLSPVDATATGKSYFHLFSMGVYFTPLLGGYLADRFFGKYHTILWLSLVYCLGHLCLALFDTNPTGFYFGLFLIALGSGGIKPLVSAMVGDQFTESNKHLVKKVFAVFYWSINFGSFFASLLIPKILKLYGPAVAFGIPGILMFIATVIFWLGRKQYVNVPPTGENPHSFLKVISSARRNRQPGQAHWLDGARAEHPEEAVEGTKAVFRIIVLFSMIPVFWALFDQKASTWVVQAKSMDPNVGGWVFEPSQMQLVNPMLVMLLIPFTTYFLYPWSERIGFPLTPLRRMTIGMVFAGVSFVIAGFIQVALQGGNTLSILWQGIPYIVLTLAEVLVSVTGLEFAYTQAPRAMKGTIMAVWNLAVASGNFLVAVLAKANVFTGATQFFFYAGLIFVAAVIFGFIASRYKVVDWFRREEPEKPAGEHAMPTPSKAG